MTTIVSTAVLVLFVLVCLPSVIDGNVGFDCKETADCETSEECGTGGTCDCLPEYDAIQTTCVKDCPDLDNIVNGSVRIVSNETTIQFEAIYECDNSYELQGEPRRLCLETALWSGSMPSCNKIDSGSPCDSNPCPTLPGSEASVPCVTRIDDSDKEAISSHVCICPVGLKGPDCTEDDPPITCNEKTTKSIHFEEDPDVNETAVCLRERDTNTTHVCINPNETIVYKFTATDDIAVDDNDGMYCLTYTNRAPQVSEVCVEVIAFEEDDIVYRPWINDTFEVCFKFNVAPTFLPLDNQPLLYNIVHMPDTVSIPLKATDPDVNQALNFSLIDVSHVELKDKFTIADDMLVISNPIDLHPKYPDIFAVMSQVEIRVMDNGIPALEEYMNIMINFIYEKLECMPSDKVFMLHLVPVPDTSIDLGNITCIIVGKNQSPAFEIISDPGPVLVKSDGTIVYDPTADINRGLFDIKVNASTTLTLELWTIIQFSVFANDFSPRCTNSSTMLSAISFSEKDVNNTCSDILFTCDDPANLTKTCRDTSDSFDVFCDSVSSNIIQMKICTAASLDLRGGSSEEVSVKVENSYGVDVIELLIRIENVNDPPRINLDVSQIDIEIKEDVKVPYPLETIPIEDPDIKADPPDTLSVTITDLDEIQNGVKLPFTAELSAFNTAITVTMVTMLNPAERHAYLLQIKLEDSAGESDSVDLNITILDVNQKPTCQPEPITAPVTVRDVEDYLVAHATCSDPDFTSQYNTLSYSLIGDESVIKYFKIDANGDIRLKEALTSFTSSTTLNFTIRVTDGGGLSDDVPITVSISTSYPPECEQFVVSESISEQTATTECFPLAVSCSDPVKQETLVFRGASGNGTQILSLSMEKTTNDELYLCTVGSLQGKVGEWLLNVVVASSYGFGNIKVTVTVEDVNEPPSCTPTMIALKTTVKDVENKELTRLNCTDPDINSAFNVLSYTLEGQAGVISYFKMEENVVGLAKSLADIIGDNNVLSFRVRVKDGGNLSETVTVTVTVANIFPPQCEVSDIEEVKSETTDANVCFDIKTGCTDSVRNELLLFSLTSGNGTKLFMLGESKDGHIALCTKSPLQGEYGTWEMNAVVKSSYGETNVHIIIRVSDKNDAPLFDSSSYEVSIMEDISVGVKILTVTANDADSGAFGKLTYHSNEMDGSVFSLNMNGEISVNSPLDADRSATNKYTFEVKAIDGALVPLSATTMVIIEIHDVNDEVPVCSFTSDEVNISLLSLPDTAIKQLDCSDADKSPEFHQLIYSTTSPYFAINDTGHLIVANDLPRDMTLHTVIIKVTDSNKLRDPDYTINVVIYVNVDTGIPPDCDPLTIDCTLSEMDEGSLCIEKKVTCTDPTRERVYLQSQSGTAKDKHLLDLRISNETPESLGLSAHINSTLKDKFGEYKLIAIISNGLGTTIITWNFIVKNVNEPPVFIPDTYNVSIQEDQNEQREILHLTVSDPDDGKEPDDFVLQSVSAELTNNADFNGANNNSFLFSDKARSFYYVSKLNASVRDVYKYTVKAVDRSGLSATADVVITILDVNSPPICQLTTIDVDTNILAKKSSVVHTIFCYDTDFDQPNIQLDYAIIEGDPDGYFNMTPNAKLVIQKAFPRNKLYNTGVATLLVEISDNGTPSLSTNVTVIVNVANSIPATCMPVITPPNIWVKDSCAIVTMDCTDPTTTDVNHLKYDTSGNFTDGFSIASNADGIIKLCYTLIKVDGVYQISVNVDNGLAIYSFTDYITVSYLKATPVFSESKYIANIPETTEANIVIVTVSATVDSSSGVVGNVIYRILGKESTTGWDTYFALDGTTGTITTVTGIKQLADQVYTIKVEAEDSVSKLSSSALVELTIEDINETPSCDLTSTSLDLVVDVAVDTTIIVFQCSDPDVKEEYKTLLYDISGNDVNTYFKLVGNPALSVAVKAPLDVSSTGYTITLTVSDSGTPPLSFSREFPVTVNTLPPPVKVNLIDIGHNTIKIAWAYARTDFDTVTNFFIVKAYTTNNILEIESQQIVEHEFELTELVAMTTYIIVVEANSKVGTRRSNELSATTQEVPVLTLMTATVVLMDEDYNKLLRDRDSQLYHTKSTMVKANVDAVLAKSPGFVGTTEVQFRPYNSVLADIKFAVNQSGDGQITIQTLRDTVSTGWIGDISVNSDYFKASIGDGYISIESLWYEPTEVYNGTEVLLLCNITSVGYSEDATFTYWWTFRRIQLHPKSGSRYSISTSPEVEIYENKHSSLRINPVLAQDSGLYGCLVSDADAIHTEEKLIEVTIISQPIVIIAPKSLTVKYGEMVNVTCQLIAGSPGTFEGFVWYRNGEPNTTDEERTSATTMTFTFRADEPSIIIGCEGKNKAGTGERVYSNIGVIPPGATDDQLCPASEGSRGTTWPLSAIGLVVRLVCDDDYTGEIYRECVAGATWEDPFYDCVKEELHDIEQQIQDIKDGLGTTNVTTALVALNTAIEKPLYEGDIRTALKILDISVEVTDEPGETEDTTKQTLNFMEICSRLLSEDNQLAWKSRIDVGEDGAIYVPKLVDNYLGKMPVAAEETISVENIYAKIGSEMRDTYRFPDRSEQIPDWIGASKTEIFVPKEALPKDNPTLAYQVSFFRNITPILTMKLMQDGKVRDISNVLDINSDIVTFKLKQDIGTIYPEAEITFHHFDSNYSNPICCYWDYDQEAFVTDGCSLDSTSDTVTVCKCNHFTNFAVLMSPGKTPDADVVALSIISAVGCAISIVCLILTVILYLMVWRFVKSDRAVLLLNLCVALILSYVVFLAGVDRTENKNVCTAISVLLHYIYLVVFFLMLAYGIEIAIAVVYVFVTRSRLKWLLPLAWGLPLIIVGISMAVTKLEGYGNDRFCWLSIEDGLLWAFVGPAALIILINFIIVVIVFRQLFKSSAMMTKSDKDKAVTGVRSLCVLLPILGLTWVFGVFSVNEDLVAFQYIFAICNTLQGFLIFVFHCFLNKQLKQALRQRREKKKSLASIELNFKNQHSSSTGSTSFFPMENKAAQNKNVDVGNSNPFLEADRQMKEMVGKNKNNANLKDNNAVNNKVDVDKVSKAVDLDDVKISNILRESEVMGGTTGISSILHADTRGEEVPAVRSSMVSSSHRYDYIDLNQTDDSPVIGIQKPPGYEKLFQSTSQGTSASKDSGHTGSESDKGRDRGRLEKEREIERERERERQKKIEQEKRDRFDRERKECEASERENEERQRKEEERKEREKYEREKHEMDIHRDGGVLRIGFDNEGFRGEPVWQRDGPYDRRGQPTSAGRSNRSDDDYENATSSQNLTSISTALPEKFELYQGKKHQKEAQTQAEPTQKKKEKKKTSLKDRSKAYEYSYDTTYLGGSSRHASLENMNMQNIGYSPYAQMPGMGAYQTGGRPTHQHQHWDEYRYSRDPRDPRESRDYRDPRNTRDQRDPRDYRDPRDPYNRERDYW